MEEQPDFTIVTPSYNYGRYIRDCIESVFAQEGVTYEHIIHDSCSTDDTHQILAEYPHLKVFVEKDSGMSEGINRGFLKAKGKWVMWFNTDDVMKPGALLAVKKMIESRPEADIIHGGWEFVNQDRKHLRYMKGIPAKLGIMTYCGCYLPSTALYLKKETTIDQGFLLNENFRYNMDGEYYVRLKKAGKIFRHINKVLAEFRLHDENLSGIQIAEQDVTEQLFKQRKLAEVRAVARANGRYFTRFLPINDISDAVLSQWFRLYKGFLQLTTPWKDGTPI